jgi:hypothetical protein
MQAQTVEQLGSLVMQSRSAVMGRSRTQVGRFDARHACRLRRSLQKAATATMELSVRSIAYTGTVRAGLLG